MNEDLMNFDLHRNKSSIIKVIGVGGGGSNAVNHMYRMGIKDVDFIVCNTDAQALANSPVPVKIQLGSALTEGRGAGNKPDVGRQAAIENLQDVVDVLSLNTKMVFITAGMGGGTGTGAAPIIAKTAKEMGILTVAIITLPFRFEGQQRINQAIEGINEIKNYVDSLLVIHNEKLREMFGNLKLSEAFSKADNILTTAAKGIAEVITVHGYVNVDFADVRTVMADSGVAIMGSATAEGENRALQAIQQALISPLLNNNDIQGARNILLNITSGEDEISMDEVGIITDFVTNTVAKDTLLIWGTGSDPSMGDKISVTIVATGFEHNSIPEIYSRRKSAIESIPLYEDIRKPSVTQPAFEVKTIDGSIDNRKRAVEFDISNVIEPTLFPGEFEVKVNKGKSAERLTDIKKVQTKMKESVQMQTNPIDELESQPAYVRKKINLGDIPNPSGAEVSKVTLSDDPDRKVVLKSENPYLNKKVD